MQKYVAPADGARSGLGGAEIRIGTPGSVRRPGASGAHRSERRGFWGAWWWGWWIFAGAERCGARGLADGEAGGEKKEREPKCEDLRVLLTSFDAPWPTFGVPEASLELP